MKKLYRSRSNRVFAGIAGGLGEYFGVDPVVVRLIWLVLIFLWGTGLVAYLIAWIIIPKEPLVTNAGNLIQSVPATERKDGKIFFGIMFIIIGLILLARQDWDLWWRIKDLMRDVIRYAVPAGLILIGVYLLIPRRGTTSESTDKAEPNP